MTQSFLAARKFIIVLFVFSFAASAEDLRMNFGPVFESGWIHHSTTVPSDANKTGFEEGLGGQLRFLRPSGDSFDISVLFHFFSVTGTNSVGVNKDISSTFVSTTAGYNFAFGEWGVGPSLRFRDGAGAKFDDGAHRVMTPVFSVGAQGKYVTAWNGLELHAAAYYDTNNTDQQVWTVLVQAAMPLWNW